MTAPIRAAAIADAARTPSTVPAHARVLAARLAALFQADSEVVGALNDAHHLLASSNDRLRSAPAADPFVIHQQIQRAFCAYQSRSEQRRQLAVHVGELSQQLTDALTSIGYTAEQASSADVHELAAGTWQATEERKQSER